jgi:pimeloyl-ACP methyl ester carboxylesterase
MVLERRSTFVLVHGAWAGGWAWREVASHLRAAGHEVFTPTLTGLGERVHLATPETDLDTHIQDILGVLEYEMLRDVILVGHSYGGMVVTGVAERAPERLAHLVYLDALVPEDGQSLADIFGPEIGARLEGAARAYGEGWRVPHDPPDAPRMTPHPLKTGVQALAVKNPAARALPRTFIYCTEGKEEMATGFAITRAAERAKTAGSWRYLELPTRHVPMETAPLELAATLHGIAAQSPSEAS